MGLRSYSRHRLRGRGTASAVEGANFVLFRNFCVRCNLILLVLGSGFHARPCKPVKPKEGLTCAELHNLLLQKKSFEEIIACAKQ